MPLFHHRELRDLPKLAWIASLDTASGDIAVLHGCGVEVRPDWLVEGVWDGEFGAGDFHRAANFFGSGVRREGEAMYFVPSTALVDRLLYCFCEQELLVSNSLALLLGFTGARMDPQHNYRTTSFTILKGIRSYERAFPVVHPRISSFFQLYYQRMVFRDREISFVDPPEGPPIESFGGYRHLLARTLGMIRDNYNSSARTHPVSAFSTLSSGYDSTAVTALVRDLPIDSCFTSHASNSTIPRWVSRHAAIDSGKPVADALGVLVRYLDPRRSSVTEDELYFLAPSSAEVELIFHSMARHIEQNSDVAVVFTGFHGDKVWDVNTTGKYLSDEIVRGDISGLNLSEIRLKSGFINVAVPFVSARRIRDIVDVASSAEMEPWRLHNTYDRPIPRRIAETVGVPRGAFGIRKKAVVQHYNYPVHPSLRRKFFDHLRETQGFRPAFVYLHEKLNKLAFLAVGSVDKLRGAFGIERDTPRLIVRSDIDLPYLMYVWSADELARRLAEVLSSNGAGWSNHPARTSAAAAMGRDEG